VARRRKRQAGIDFWWTTGKARRTHLTMQCMACNIYYMPPRQKTYDTMTEAILESMAESELSFKSIERETGVLRQSLMKFAAGEQTIRLDAADKLAAFFGLEITRRKANDGKRVPKDGHKAASPESGNRHTKR